MRVCVIDDDDIYQYLLKKELNHTNMVDSVTVFTDGKKALNHFTELLNTPEEWPDVIFLDINMPIMNGWQFLDDFHELKKKTDKRVTIYLVSSSFDDRDISRSKQYPDVTDYIIKPVKRSNLVSVLQEISENL